MSVLVARSGSRIKGMAVLMSSVITGMSFGKPERISYDSIILDSDNIALFALPLGLSYPYLCVVFIENIRARSHSFILPPGLEHV